MKIFPTVATLAVAATIFASCNSNNVSSDPAPSSVAVSRAVNPEIEKMKRCAKDAKRARARWYFEETGLTTTADSGAAQRYYSQIKAMGLNTKTPIPMPICG